MTFWLEFQHGQVKRNNQTLNVLPLQAMPPDALAQGIDGKTVVLTVGTRVNIEKSALLGRLMRGEEIRRKPCPKHQGTMWCAWGLAAAGEYACCDGTGWLKNEAEPPVQDGA